MPRKAKTYREYPDSHFSILQKFRDGETEVSIPMTVREAYTSRHQLHRFFKAIGTAALNGDPVAERLLEISKNLTIRVIKDSPALLIKLSALSTAFGDSPSKDNMTSPGGGEKEITAAEIENVIRRRKKKS